jgi:hypothetical protein
LKLSIRHKTGFFPEQLHFLLSNLSSALLRCIYCSSVGGPAAADEAARADFSNTVDPAVLHLLQTAEEAKRILEANLAESQVIRH